MWSIEWHHFQWPWTNPNSYFKVTLLSDAAYPRNGTKYRHSCKWIPRPTQMSHFKRPWVIFSDLTTYSVTQSIARFLCDNWIFCSMPNVMSKNNTPTQLLYKKLSCRRETARCFVSLNILLTMLSRACVSPYYYSIETTSVSRSVSDIFSVKEWRDFETSGMGRSRSLYMAPFDTTFYWSAIVSIALCCTVFELFDVE